MVTHARWTIRGYAPPNQGGALLLETWHTTESSKDMEIDVWRVRMRSGEVGRVEVDDHVQPQQSEVILW